MPSNHPRVWALTAVTIAWLAVAAIMFGVLLPSVAAACGAPALDARFTWGAADAGSLMAGCGDTGRRAYEAQQAFDVAYPLLLAASLGGWTWLAARSARRSTGLAAALCAPAIVSMLADYGENACIGILISADGVPTVAAALGGGLSAIKNVAGAAAFALLAAVAAMVVWRESRRFRPGRPVGGRLEQRQNGGGDA